MVFFVPETVILTDQIPATTSLFTSKQLQSIKRTPQRIYIAFVTTEAFSGHKHQNPFDFRRHWEVKTGSGVSNIQAPSSEVNLDDSASESIEAISSEDEYDLLDSLQRSSSAIASSSVPSAAQLKRMSKKSMMEYIQGFFSRSQERRSPSVSSKGGKTRSGGEGTAATVETAQAASTPAASPSKKLRRSKRRQAPSDVSKPNVLGPLSIDGQDPDIYSSTKKYCFIEEIVLKMNNNEQPRLSGPSSRLHCPKEFIRFMEVQNNFRTNQSDGISYDMFNSNFYFSAFDLKSSVSSGDNMIPSVPEGDQLRFHIKFSEALPQETTMLIVCCFTSAVQLSSNNTVQTSFLNRVN